MVFARKVLLCLAVLAAVSPPARALREEDRRVSTQDGWTLALHRYLPDRPSYQEPVLLTHGFIENRRIWDLDPEHSLARRLAERGFEVWTMELRGSGGSAAPGDGSVKAWAFGIPDFVRYDAPAAIDEVRRVSGASQVLMVGHSLGGLITYGVLEGPEALKIRAAVTLAGAGTMSGGKDLKLALNNFFRVLGVTLGPRLPDDAPFPIAAVMHRVLGRNERAWEILGRALDTKLGHPFWSEGDMSPEGVSKLLRTAVTDTSLNVVKQFLSYAEEGKVEGVTEALSSINAPVLALAGSDDLVVPAVNVRLVAASCGAEYAEFAGVGHEDIAVGREAPIQIYPLVANWLAAHATAKPVLASSLP